MLNLEFMPPHFKFQYRFHPAGQGTFASGTVLMIANGRMSPPFHWVFDCGSTSPTEVLRPVVERYRDFITGDRLNLLCISHLDKDHVNGLGDLLKDLQIDTVVLPYWSSIERLIAGAAVEDPDADYIEFLGNPVAFVIERARSVRQILLTGVPEEPPPDEQVGDRPPRPDGGGGADPRNDIPEWGWGIKFDMRGTNMDHALSEETIELAKRSDVGLQSCGSRLSIFAAPQSANAVWEFLFHHKSIDQVAILAIREKLRQKVSSGSFANGSNIADLLGDSSQREAIRGIYESLVPDGESVNSTSLCVYSGPDLARIQDGWLSNPSPDPCFGLADGSFSRHFPPHDLPMSILYTGDADFKLRSNRLELNRFLTQPRWERIAILQVPHHGSRNNWEVGSECEFQHRHSVFCADENHRTFKHPHREVVLDLLHRGPLLANKSIGWSWRGGAVYQ